MGRGKKESHENMADMRSEFRAKIAGMREQERIRRAALEQHIALAWSGQHRFTASQSRQQ